MKRVLAVSVVVIAVLLEGPNQHVEAVQPATPTPAKDSPAAERTRTQLLKVKVTGDFRNVSLREALKELAAQVEMEAERPVMWTYPEAVPAGQPITYSCSNKPLDAVLDDVCTRLKIGYVVISEDDHARDGWVRLTTGAERGFAAGGAPTASDEDEQKAATRLAAGKEQIEKGRTATGRAILNGLVEKFPKTKAAAEAKALLEKLDK